MRGAIENDKRARQQRDYSKLRYGKITPTDHDGHIEYQNKAHIFWELKYTVPEVPLGQEIAIKRLADDLTRIKPTIYIIAVHNTHNPDIDIPAHKALVVRYRLGYKWNTPNKPITLKELVDDFIREIDSEMEEAK